MALSIDRQEFQDLKFAECQWQRSYPSSEEDTCLVKVFRGMSHWFAFNVGLINFQWYRECLGIRFISDPKPLPEVSFSVTKERDLFQTHEIWAKVTRVFWEVLYWVIPIIGILRYVAIKFVVLPSIRFSSDKCALDHTRDEFELNKLDANIKVQRSIIKTADGVKLDTYELRCVSQEAVESKNQKWVVFFNGNNSNYEDYLEDYQKVALQTGANFYTGNYRGVGFSESFPWMSQDLVLDGEAMVQKLLHDGVRPKNILIYGWSIGGGVGAEVAGLHEGMHFVSDRSFASFGHEVEAILAGSGEKIMFEKLQEQGSLEETTPAREKKVALEKIRNAKEVMRIIGKIAAVSAYFFGWIFDSVAAFNKVTGDKAILYNRCDLVIPYVVSLDYAMAEKGGHQSIALKNDCETWEKVQDDHPDREFWILSDKYKKIVIQGDEYCQGVLFHGAPIFMENFWNDASRAEFLGFVRDALGLQFSAHAETLAV